MPIKISVYPKELTTTIRNTLQALNAEEQGYKELLSSSFKGGKRLNNTDKNDWSNRTIRCKQLQNCGAYYNTYTVKTTTNCQENH